jgi:mono/diheme cytochrome c family protein
MPMKIRLPAVRWLIASIALTAAGHAAADSTGRWQSGQEAYKKVCAYCHEANVGPVLTGRNLPPAYITSVVRAGNQAMPAFRPSEIDDGTLNSLARMIAASASGPKQ